MNTTNRYFVSLVTCLRGLLASSCGSSPDETTFPEECRNQCELAGSCEMIAFEEYPKFDVTLAEWQAGCAHLLFAVAGECADGTSVLRKGNGHTGEMRLYDAEGDFRGLETSTDVSSPPCNARGYWPEVISCPSPLVTEVLCGTQFAVGDAVDTRHWGR